MTKALVHIDSGAATIEGMLELPHDAAGVVLFAHGSGSSRLSPRNNHVAHVLRDAGIGTLLLDLLTPHEDRNVHHRFDIVLLTARLRTAAAWLGVQDATAPLPLGLFGASTGAAAALQLAADPAVPVVAVVSRGGRPCVKRLAIVPGATHLFEEPGALEEVARLAAEWCTQQFGHH